jgi:DNA-binding NtrC family response regulator
MTRILIIEPQRAVRETVERLLGREYEIDARDSVPDRATLAQAAAGADLAIANSGLSAWTAELARLNIPVLVLGDFKRAARVFGARENVRILPRPFNPYEFKSAVEDLLSRPKVINSVRMSSGDWLDFPFLSRGASLLARRFETLALPVLLWGERGCGQDRVARALVRRQTSAGAIVVLNGFDVTAEGLRTVRDRLRLLDATPDSHPALVIDALDQVARGAQGLLLELIDELQETGGCVRIVATATADLLERVYRGDFFERLYYRVAKLALPLAPLRERRADLPELARRLAADYAAAMNLREVNFTPPALARLSDDLWFGNVEELDLVIARTLAIHPKTLIDVADLVFDVSAAVRTGDVASVATETGCRAGQTSGPQNGIHQPAPLLPAVPLNGGAPVSPNLRLLVHELAHELKNPMVTIKTFAQLLGERYDDASFRARFQAVVDGDIERMDELLEVMAEYAGFDQPRRASTVFMEVLRSTADAVREECLKRKVQLGWKGNGQGVKIMADVAQLSYALRHTLLAVLSQAKADSEVELALGSSGALVISYRREGERLPSLATYFKDGEVPSTGSIVPLRIILAQEIIERSGGLFRMEQGDGERESVTVEFPVV